jgi:hypothetical protein
MINIFHHGAVSGVTGSCHELSITPSDRSNPSAGILKAELSCRLTVLNNCIRRWLDINGVKP